MIIIYSTFPIATRKMDALQLHICPWTRHKQKEDALYFDTVTIETLQSLLNYTWYMCEGTSHLCGALFTPDGNNTRTCDNQVLDKSFPISHRCAIFRENSDSGGSQISTISRLCGQGIQGEWAYRAFDKNLTVIERLCCVRTKFDPNELAVTPCSFHFCFCSSTNRISIVSTIKNNRNLTEINWKCLENLRDA